MFTPITITYQDPNPRKQSSCVDILPTAPKNLEKKMPQIHPIHPIHPLRKISAAKSIISSHWRMELMAYTRIQKIRVQKKKNIRPPFPSFALGKIPLPMVVVMVFYSHIPPPIPYLTPNQLLAYHFLLFLFLLQTSDPTHQNSHPRALETYRKARWVF